MNLDRNVYEGWTPRDFIEAIQNDIHREMELSKAGVRHEEIKTRTQMGKLTAFYQPYYGKKVPEVVSYFCKLYGIK